MTYGLSLAGVGLLLVSRISIDTSYLWMMPDLRDDGDRDRGHDGADDRRGDERVGRERAGLGSATTNTAREVGGVLGIALLGAIPRQIEPVPSRPRSAKSG